MRIEAHAHNKSFQSVSGLKVLHRTALLPLRSAKAAAAQKG